MPQITIYQRHDAFRVVANDHAAHADSKSYRVAVYPNAQLAYAAETSPAIRAAILRIASDAATDTSPGGLPPVRKVPLSRAVVADALANIKRDLSGRDITLTHGSITEEFHDDESRRAFWDEWTGVKLAAEITMPPSLSAFLRRQAD